MSFVVALGVRYLLVCLFFPFSALDKVLNFDGAKAQAKELAPNDIVATGLIVCGLCVEIVMPVAILLGIVDRLAAFVLAIYCCATAVLWKTFWQPSDFWKRGDSTGRTLFWDFMKNLSLAGGFLLLAFGSQQGGFQAFLNDPFASSRPYAKGAHVGDIRPEISSADRGAR